MARSMIRMMCSLLLLVLVTPSHGQAQFERVIIFGDSLSDTGNLAIINLPFPYFENRISNGPVAADFVTQSLGLNADRSGHLFSNGSGNNFSVAGGNIIGGDPEDLTQQIDAFFARDSDPLSSLDLVIVFMGGNDLRDIRNIADESSAAQRINETIMVIKQQLQRLVDAGARKIFVPNVANIGRVPETLNRETSDPGVSSLAANYVRSYNQLLESSLSGLIDAGDTEIVIFDLFSALESILETPQAFGFDNSTQGCFDPDEFDIETSCVLFGLNSRVFFDSLHPSSKTHQLIAQQMISFLPKPTPPETELAAVDFLSGILLILLDD